MVEVTALSIRERPTRNSEKVGEVGQGNPVEVLCVEPVFADERVWLRVRHGDTEGWMSSRYLSVNELLLDDRYAGEVCGQARVVEVTALSIREQPSRDSAYLGEVSGNQTVDVLCVPPVSADDRVWFRVRSGSIEGWMSSRYLQLDEER
ncbi:MAG: SH3 domain-containing protein [Chloroflexaceae bacterium]|nr:SH3 domain-containing protein [Chloroflexaceae bacterium]